MQTDDLHLMNPNRAKLRDAVFKAAKAYHTAEGRTRAAAKDVATALHCWGYDVTRRVQESGDADGMVF